MTRKFVFETSKEKVSGFIPRTLSLALFIGLWIICIALLYMGMGDIFHESAFSAKHFLLYLIMIASTGAAARVSIDYLRMRIR